MAIIQVMGGLTGLPEDSRKGGTHSSLEQVLEICDILVRIRINGSLAPDLDRTPDFTPFFSIISVRSTSL